MSTELEDALTSGPLIDSRFFAEVPDLLGVIARAEERANLQRGRDLASGFVTWAKAALPVEEDRMEFLGELVDALQALRAGDDGLMLESVMREWATTAVALSDSKRREVLLGESTADDYVEVDR